MTLRLAPVVVLLSMAAVWSMGLGAQPSVRAIAGATLIDGSGSAAVSDAVVVIQDGVVTAAGPRASVAIPAGATVIDAKG